METPWGFTEALGRACIWKSTDDSQGTITKQSELVQISELTVMKFTDPES